MKLLLASLSALVVSALACSSGSSSTGAPGGSTSTSSSSGNQGASSTLAGKPFVVASGVVHQEKDGTISIVLADQPDLCEQITTERLRPGLTIVQAYRLQGTAPGAFSGADEEVKFARLASSCPSGESVNDHVEASGRAAAAVNPVTLSALSAERATGVMQVTFPNGSSVDVAFDVPACDVVEAEHAVCE
ncbi:MAG: hypothetical protein JWP97_6092 [Labilithrix sp.]|nr:hypothetical protein [Labilithrix sp.]